MGSLLRPPTLMPRNSATETTPGAAFGRSLILQADDTRGAGSGSLLLALEPSGSGGGSW